MNGQDITEENLTLPKMPLNRRLFMKFAFGAAGIGISGFLGFRSFFKPTPIKGTLSGASFKRGHTLLTGGFTKIGNTKQKDIIIVGAGMAGLHAGWWLKKNGIKDFVILELEDEVGGKSRFRSGEKVDSPLGAHYLPLPNPEARHTIELLKEMGVIVGENEDGLVYKEDYLCFEPKERLFIHGRWQEGMVPSSGLGNEDKNEVERFFKIMNDFKNLKGSDHKYVFNIPVETSSSDPIYKSLDKLTMLEWMESHSFSSKYLKWYVNYCCLDDFGTKLSEVSAWAGIHYFASRRGGGSNAPAGSVLTWPEGNGFIVKYLQDQLKSHIKTAQMVKKITHSNDKNLVQVDNFKTNAQDLWISKKVIYSAPRFIAKHIIDDLKMPENLDYSPWMVGNIELRNLNENPDFHWDNVNYHGKSLGYIYANHMNLKSYESHHTLTLYWPLIDEEPKKERKKAISRNHSDWTKQIVEELEVMHPGISKDIKRVDVWTWGHAMVRPVPDFIWGESRQLMKNNIKNKIFFAHSDMSGMSLCEEAGYWGVQAANEVLKSV